MILPSRILPAVSLLLGLLVSGGILSAADSAPAKKVVLIAGKKSHAVNTHEYEKGVRLFKDCLDHSPNVKGIETIVVTDGWPEDEKVLDDAATILLFSDGSDGAEKNHPLLNGDRMDKLGKQMQRGCGFMEVHYATFTPREKAPQFLEWVGGFYDYESGPPPNNWWSKHEVIEVDLELPSPEHPISRGLAPLKLKEEYYYNMRFRTPDERRKSILSFGDDVEVGTVAWAIERADGGRGFAYTGGHFHRNWAEETIRRMALNAILWTAHADVPADEVQSKLPADWEAQFSTLPKKDK